jgi:hypothetical protein
MYDVMSARASIGERHLRVSLLSRDHLTVGESRFPIPDEQGAESDLEANLLDELGDVDEGIAEPQAQFVVHDVRLVGMLATRPFRDRPDRRRRELSPIELIDLHCGPGVRLERRGSSARLHQVCIRSSASGP